MKRWAKFIFHFSLKLFIQFWNFFYSMVLWSEGSGYHQKRLSDFLAWLPKCLQVKLRNIVQANKITIKEPSKVCWDLAVLTLDTTWKMKFSVNDFFGRNLQQIVYLFTFTKKILRNKFDFLLSTLIKFH